MIQSPVVQMVSFLKYQVTSIPRDSVAGSTNGQFSEITKEPVYPVIQSRVGQMVSFPKYRGTSIPCDSVIGSTNLTIMDPPLWDDILIIMYHGESLNVLLPMFGSYFCTENLDSE